MNFELSEILRGCIPARCRDCRVALPQCQDLSARNSKKDLARPRKASVGLMNQVSIYKIFDQIQEKP